MEGTFVNQKLFEVTFRYPRQKWPGVIFQYWHIPDQPID